MVSRAYSVFVLDEYTSIQEHMIIIAHGTSIRLWQINSLTPAGIINSNLNFYQQKNNIWYAIIKIHNYYDSNLEIFVISNHLCSKFKSNLLDFICKVTKIIAHPTIESA